MRCVNANEITIRFAFGLVAAGCMCLGMSCGGNAHPQNSQKDATASSAPTFDARPPSATIPGAVKAPAKAGEKQQSPIAPRPTTPEIRPALPSRNLAELAEKPLAPQEIPPAPIMPVIDDAAVASLGIRKVAGKHLVLYTDLPLNPAVDELPIAFDQAVPQWCEYFHIPEKNMDRWRITGHLIIDKDKFKRAGLLPGDLPEFLHGYQRGAEIWLYEQPSDYYRRHLLLHEGTHAFMMWCLQGAGPPWYMEGTAELFATHRWQDGKLTMRYFPPDKKEVPEWGRIKIVKDDVRANRAKTLLDVMHYDSRAHLRVEPYGWCWAAAAFFDSHPAYQQRFRDLQKYARDTEQSFSDRFLGRFEEDGHRVWREWQWFVTNLDYGYDCEREAFLFKPVAALPENGMRVEIAADRGWQSTGVQLEEGKKYRILATGRYQLAAQPKIWWCEPNGVTIRYHRGQPLGVLLGALIDESNARPDDDNQFLSPLVIGSGTEISPQRSGTLYCRINDAANELADNQGSASVQIEFNPQ